MENETTERLSIQHYNQYALHQAIARLMTELPESVTHSRHVMGLDAKRELTLLDRTGNDLSCVLRVEAAAHSWRKQLNLFVTITPPVKLLTRLLGRETPNVLSYSLLLTEESSTYPEEEAPVYASNGDFSPSLFVGIPYRDLGIGTALFEEIDSLRSAVVTLLSMHLPIKTLVINVGDGTDEYEESNIGWTTRQLDRAGVAGGKIRTKIIRL